MDPSVATQRAKVASLSRSRTADDPELVDARRALEAAKLEAYVAKVVAQAPPLTDAQKARISALLAPGVRAAREAWEAGELRRPSSVTEAFAARD